VMPLADPLQTVADNVDSVVLAAAKMDAIEAAPGAAVSAGNSATAAATSATQAARKAVAMSLIFGA